MYTKIKRIILISFDICKIYTYIYTYINNVQKVFDLSEFKKYFGDGCMSTKYVSLVNTTDDGYMIFKQSYRIFLFFFLYKFLLFRKTFYFSDV